jgi:stearoyl-CoA desaturase (delta-9 desaturase)
MSTGWPVALVAWYLVVFACGVANTIGYHRLLAHHAFKTRPWLRNGLTFLSALYSGAPMPWVGAHRIHHTLSDRPGDPHSPTKGFWFAHAGWLIGSRQPVLCALFALAGVGLQARFVVVDLLRLVGKHPPIWRKMTRDLRQERFMRWLDVPLVIPALFALQVTAAWLVGGVWGLVWLWAAHAFLNNATWIVNSACHWPGLGRGPHATRDQSRNVRWLALLTHGEANHNSHHKYPKSACHGIDGELDPSWAIIRALARVRLVWDVQLPPERQAHSARATDSAVEAA